MKKNTSAFKTEYAGYVFFLLAFICFYLLILPEAILAKEKNIIWTGSFVAGLFLMSVALAVGSVFFCLGMKRLYLKSGINRVFAVPSVKLSGKDKEKKGFRSRFIWIILAYMPAYLAYYPGICSYDITIQQEQILSHQYIEHHPLAHTLLVEGFLNVGKFLGNANLGMGLYSLLQVLLYGAAFAYGISVIEKKDASKGILWLLQLYAMFFPYHWYLSLSTTKDSLFAVFVLFFVILFYELLGEAPGHFRKKTVGYVLAGVGMILFRNNARYAYMVVVLVLFLVTVFIKKERKKYASLLVASLTGLILAMGLLTGLSKVCHAAAGDKREMLSVPIQQLSRVMVYHEEEISEKDKKLINDFLTEEAYRWYRPEIADPVKKYTYTYVFRYRFREFMETYVGLFFRYPGDYVNAFLTLNAGYLYPFDESHAWINVNGKDVGLGFIQTRFLEEDLKLLGVYKDSKFPVMRKWLEDFADRNFYLKLPILRYLFMPGGYFWCWVFWGVFLLWKKKYKELLPLLYVLAYLGTLLLGPTVQLRYLYPFMIALPFAILLTGKRVENEV